MTPIHPRYLLAYLFWIIAGLLAIPATAGLAAGLLVVFVALVLGAALALICSIPILVWLILADARFWRLITYGKLPKN